MSVGHSRHGVDLEVFVGADTCGSLDGSPVGPAGLGIVEPLVAQVLHVVGIKVRDAGSDLRSVDTATN